jgi:TolB-like protein
MLSPRRANRYQVMDDVAVDLRRLGRDLESGSSPTYAEVGKAGGLKRRPWMVALMTSVIVAALFVNGFLIRDRFVQRPVVATGKIMLAVLPFENLSGDPEQEFFSDGMTEEMIAQLGRLQPRKLGVIARTSVMQFKNTDKRIDRIGRELGVDFLLEGSVRRAAERVRITAQLIQVSDQTHLWAESYERNASDVFAIQKEVAESVAGSLAIELLPAEARPIDTPAANLQAHEAYLRGRFFWNKRTKNGLMTAIKHFEQAIEEDPEFAPAYVGLADSYNMLAAWDLVPPQEAFPKAIVAATKALEIDETLAEAQISLALTRFFYDWDWDGAEQGFQRALELNPNYAQGHQWYGLFLVSLGRGQEAVVEAEHARELDPLSLIINAMTGYVFHYVREYDQVIEQCQRRH